MHNVTIEFFPCHAALTLRLNNYTKQWVELPYLNPFLGLQYDWSAIGISIKERIAAISQLLIN